MHIYYRKDRPITYLAMANTQPVDETLSGAALVTGNYLQVGKFIIIIGR